MPQICGKVRIPKGYKIAVNIGCDFDAHSVWMGTFKLNSPAYLSRGEFGAEVAVARLLKVFARHGIKTSWCIPGHTADTWPQSCREIVAAGHEVGHHGYVHENITRMSLEQETQVMEMGLEALDRIGARPTIYRSPAWDFSVNTLAILEKYGFVGDSSLMGNDFHPYLVRPVTPHEDRASEFGPPSRILEIPVSWYLDDFPAMEWVTGVIEGLKATDSLFDRWRRTFDYAVANEEHASFVLTTHPQTVGRAHLLPELERLIEYMKANGAWFATLAEICAVTELPV